MIIYASLLLVICFIVKWIVQYIILRKKFSALPGPVNLPFVGYAWHLLKMDPEGKLFHNFFFFFF